MKKKVLILLTGILLLVLAMMFNFQKHETEKLAIKNVEALADISPEFNCTWYCMYHANAQCIECHGEYCWFEWNHIGSSITGKCKM